MGGSRERMMGRGQVGHPNAGGSGSMVRRVASAVLACLFVLSATNARAEYRLAAGDVIEITVFGVQGLTKRTTVDVDGDVSMPVLGRVRATGQSLASLRDLLHSRAAAEAATRGADVAVDLVQCRPFYISGDVKNSGAYPYVPGLTVRQAVAIAGGIAGKNRSEIPLGYIAEVEARIQRALLGGSQAPGTGGWPTGRSGRGVRSDGREPRGRYGRGQRRGDGLPTRGQAVSGSQDEASLEHASYEQMISLIGEEIRTLEAQLKQDGVAVDAQSQEVARVQDLQVQGAFFGQPGVGGVAGPGPPEKPPNGNGCAAGECEAPTRRFAEEPKQDQR